MEDWGWLTFILVVVFLGTLIGLLWDALAEKSDDEPWKELRNLFKERGWWEDIDWKDDDDNAKTVNGDH